MYRRVSNRTRLSHEVADQVKALIRAEKLKPGDKLPNETRLGELFGVSRPTVREAVNSLASQNIIEIRRGRGTFVSENPGITSDPLGLDFLAERDLPSSLTEVRLLIEPGVARLAAQRATEADLEALQRLVDDMRTITDQHEVWMKQELAFHRGIAQATGNPVIMRIVPIILEAIVKTLRYAPRTADDHRQALLEHSAILQSLRRHSSQAAAQAARRHLQNSYQRTLSIGAGRPQARQAQPAELPRRERSRRKRSSE
jgi:GntR family transcriptional repressor for pyruvate dehydrogenase complex